MAASLSGMGQSHPSGPSEEHHHDALVLFERAGNLYGVGATLDHLGDMAREGGDLLRAEELYGRALSTARKIGAGQQECLALMHLGVVRVSSGRYGEAWRELLLGCRRAERLGQNVLLATMHALCLPCAADGRRWDAWDFHDYELRRLVASIESRDEELAWAVRRGGQLAIEKGDPLRGRRALALAEELTSPSSASSVAADGDDDVESRTG